MNNKENAKKYKREITGLLSSLRFAHPDNYEVQSLYADYLIKENKDKDALDQLRLLFEMDTNNYIVAERLMLYENSNGNQDSLFILANRCITIFPKESIPYFFSGLSLLLKKEHEKSIEVLLKGLDLVNNNLQLKIQYFTFLGDAYHNIEDHYHSDLYFEKLLTIDPNNVLVLNNYAYYLSTRKEHLEKAERMSKKTIDAEPSNGTYLDTYAWILFQLNRTEDALKYIEKAYFNGGDKSAEINDHYGDILYKNDKKDMALIYWKKAKELGKEDEKLIEKIETGILD
jgi:tetratricopeptide (TPR) repeat protein